MQRAAEYTIFHLGQKISLKQTDKEDKVTMVLIILINKYMYSGNYELGLGLAIKLKVVVPFERSLAQIYSLLLLSKGFQMKCTDGCSYLLDLTEHVT